MGIMDTVEPGKFYAPKEVSSFLGCHDQTVRNMCDEGTLPYLTIRGRGHRKREHYRIPGHGVIEAFLKSYIDLGPSDPLKCRLEKKLIAYKKGVH